MKKVCIRLISAFLALILMLFSVSCGKEPHTTDYSKPITDWMIKINDVTVSSDAYRYFFLGTKILMDWGDNSYWETHSLESLKKETFNKIYSYYDVLVVADALGIALSENEEMDVDARLNGYIKESYSSEEAFLYQIESVAMTKDIKRNFFKFEALKNKVYGELFGPGGKYAVNDDNFDDMVKEYCVDFSFYLIPFDEDGSTKNKDAATNMEADLLSGMTIAEVDEKYYSYCDDYKSYFITLNSMYFDSPEVYEAISKMKIGDTSGIVMTPQGYAFIELNEPNLEEANKDKDSFISEIKNAVYIGLAAECLNEARITYAEKYDKIDIHSYDDTYMVQSQYGISN